MKKIKMNDKEREVYDNLPDEKREMFRVMTHKQRKKYSMMGKKDGDRYMYACTTKQNEDNGKEVKKRILEFATEKEDNLSHSLREEDLKESHYFCKYCGQGYSTEEEVDKHQRTCSLAI